MVKFMPKLSSKPGAMTPQKQVFWVAIISLSGLQQMSGTLVELRYSKHGNAGLAQSGTASASTKLVRVIPTIKKNINGMHMMMLHRSIFVELLLLWFGGSV